MEEKEVPREIEEMCVKKSHFGRNQKLKGIRFTDFSKISS